MYSNKFCVELDMSFPCYNWNWEFGEGYFLGMKKFFSIWRKFLKYEENRLWGNARRYSQVSKVRALVYLLPSGLHARRSQRTVQWGWPEWMQRSKEVKEKIRCFELILCHCFLFLQEPRSATHQCQWPPLWLCKTVFNRTETLQYSKQT